MVSVSILWNIILPPWDSVLSGSVVMITCSYNTIMFAAFKIRCHNLTELKPDKFVEINIYVHSFGLLVNAEKVRYITYTLMTPGCSRPDVGCTARTQIKYMTSLMGA